MPLPERARASLARAPGRARRCDPLLRGKRRLEGGRRRRNCRCLGGDTQWNLAYPRRSSRPRRSPLILARHAGATACGRHRGPGRPSPHGESGRWTSAAKTPGTGQAEPYSRLRPVSRSPSSLGSSSAWLSCRTRRPSQPRRAPLEGLDRLLAHRRARLRTPRTPSGSRFACAAPPRVFARVHSGRRSSSLRAGPGE